MDGASIQYSIKNKYKKYKEMDINPSNNIHHFDTHNF